jgi:DNA-binding NarL/FixJ family response regulator
MTTKVLLADPHEIYRDGLRSLLGKETEIMVVAEAETGQTAIEMAEKYYPDIIILDSEMPDMSGSGTIRGILDIVPTAKVIAISRHVDNRHLSEMLKSGVCGYLLKDCSSEELTRALRTVLQNHTYLSPKIANMVVTDFVYKVNDSPHDIPSVLTSREKEVLKFLAEGKTAKQTAAELHLSVKTIETHRRNISQKINIRTIAELTKYAIRVGLTSVNI